MTPSDPEALALDRAVEGRRNELWKLIAARPPQPHHLCGPESSCDAICVNAANHAQSEEAAFVALVSAITARAVAQEQARRAKLVAALEKVERLTRDAEWQAMLPGRQRNEIRRVVNAALAADREPSDPLREGR